MVNIMQRLVAGSANRAKVTTRFMLSCAEVHSMKTLLPDMKID
jgi:hypothetical protein